MTEIALGKVFGLSLRKLDRMVLPIALRKVFENGSEIDQMVFRKLGRIT
jgi:hypothetical protein